MATTDSEPSVDVEAYSTTDLKSLHEDIKAELEARRTDIDLDDAKSIELINGRWAKWATLSAHPNLKAVKPWILHVHDEHDEYGVDGDWLEKKTIDDDYHMDVSDLETGDIIKVSGASHNNRKHRFCQIVERTDNTLYYEQITEAQTIEEVTE